MRERLETLKYTFTVEGETEQWYLLWLKDKINSYDRRIYNVAFDIKVQQSPRKFYKGINQKTTPSVIHVCDIESNEPYHREKFRNILSEMKEAKDQKQISYKLGYSNYTFELWMILHKNNCNGSLSDRKQYLSPINKAYGEKFDYLEHYKKEDNFKRCLGMLTLEDVISAIKRAEVIMSNNKKDGRKLISYKGFPYYQDNPALSVHEPIKEILTACGIIK